MAKRRPRIHEAHKAAMARVQYIEQQIQAFTFAIQDLTKYGGRTNYLEEAISHILGKLHEQKSRAYEHIYMMGMFNDKDVKEIKLKVIKQLTDEGTHLENFFNDRSFWESNYCHEKAKKLQEELETEKDNIEGKNTEPWQERFNRE